MSTSSVLVVESDDTFRKWLEGEVRRAGYGVVAAATLAEGYGRARRRPLGVVLAAVGPPDGPGTGLLRDVAELLPHSLCIAMAAGGESAAAIALRDGTYDCLLKPFPATDLLRTLERAFEVVRLREEKLRTHKQLRSHKLELERLNARLRLVADSTHGLAACSSMADFGRRVLREFARNMSARGGSLFLRRNGSLVLAHSLDPGHAAASIALPVEPHSVFGRVMSSGQPVLIRDICESRGAGRSGWEGYRNGSVLAFPLADGRGDTAGVLSVHDRLEPPFTSHDLALGSILAAFAVEVLRAVQTSERLRASEEQYRRLIAERVRAEQALRKERDFVAAILDTVAALIVVVDPEGRIVHFNRACEEATGYSAAEVQGKPLFDTFIVPEELGAVQSVFRSLTEGDFPSHHENHWVTKDGDRRLISWANTVVLDRDGNAEYVLGTGIDVTDRRQAQATLDEREAQLAQLQRMEAVGRLAGGVAHDFNNLLTAILCCCELLVDQLSDRLDAREYIAEIAQSAERGASLVRQLMAFSRSQVLEPYVLDLNAIVVEMEQMLYHLIGEDVRLVTLLDQDLASIEADQSQIEMIIMNLAVNSRDAMPGGGELTIATRNVLLDRPDARLQPDLAAGRYVELALTDTGTGMSPQVQDHIFEPFYTTKEPGKGTGLGLSTVYGSVKQTGGHITVQSTPGKGTTFRILLPASDEPAKLTSRGPIAPEALRGVETVLLVEDEAPVRRHARAVLQRQGYSVLEAASPGDALLICQEHRGPIHLLLADVVMPLMNGYDLAERIVELRPSAKVLFMSGHAATILARYARRKRSSAFLQKPFSREALIHKVREALGPPRQIPRPEQPPHMRPPIDPSSPPPAAFA